MTYLGRIKGGVVVFEDSDKPEEGTLVKIEPVESAATADSPFKDLLELAGRGQGMPSDASLNVDHYLYGHPKK